VIRTDWLSSWLSKITALGAGARPASCRTRVRKVALARSQLPSSRQRRKYWETVCQGRHSWGMARQVMPPRET